jgi:membrane protease YdiL (CAAX protease family)
MPAIVEIGILGPAFEETQRLVIQRLVKRCFKEPESTKAKIVAVAASSLFSALHHYTNATPDYARDDIRYRTIPEARLRVDAHFRPRQMSYDAQMITAFFAALSLGYAHERSGSFLCPLALHAASNVALFALGLATASRK